MTFEQLMSPDFSEAELSDQNEDHVIWTVARSVFESDKEDARRIFNRQADRDPRVFFALFRSRAWPLPEPSPALWQEAIARQGLR